MQGLLLAWGVGAELLPGQMPTLQMVVQAGWGAGYHHHSLLRSSLLWESQISLSELCSWYQAGGCSSHFSRSGGNAVHCVPFQAHQRTPQGALKGSSGDRKPVHVVPNVSVQFALCTATQSLAHISERSVRWDTLALHSWGSGGLSSEGINSAANRCFHLAYKHSISVSHCILLPPC